MQINQMRLEPLEVKKDLADLMKIEGMLANFDQDFIWSAQVFQRVCTKYDEGMA